jgi:hypothetical protein
MTKGSEINYFVEVVGDDVQPAGGNNAQESTALQSAGSANDNAVFTEGVYKQSDLWGNLKIFYDNEIRQN